MATYKKSQIYHGNGKLCLEKNWITKNMYDRNHGLPYEIIYETQNQGIEIFYVNRGYFGGKLCSQIDFGIRMIKTGGQRSVIEKYKGKPYEFLYFDGKVVKGDFNPDDIYEIE